MNGLLRRVAVVVATVFMFTLVPSGTAVSGIPGGLGINLGFEDGLVGWVSNGADVSIAGTRTVSPWNVLAHGSNMAVLEPNVMSQQSIASLAETLRLSNQSMTYIKNIFEKEVDVPGLGIKNHAYIYQDISMNSGDQLTFSWNYVSTDYVPFNDGSIASMTYVGNSNVYPKINGVFTQVSILGATVPGTGNYSTGDYGSTGWQSITMEATVPGLYRIGFASFNLDDDNYSPILFVDNGAGTTYNNGALFGPIAPDGNQPPPFKVSTLSYSSKNFNESPDDNGSIESKITVSIDNDTFTGDIGEVFEPVTFSNVPAGLTAKAVKTGDKTIEISFEGNAIQHAVQNTVSNVTAAFSNDAFTIYGINETSNTVTKDLKIEFKSFGSVHFETGGGSSVDTLRIEKGTSIAKPADPIRAGYTFLGWYSTAFETSPYNFSSIFTEDSITLHARWTPNTNTIFSIEHYQEKIDGTGYELVDTEYLTGTTEDLVTASPKSYIGFSHDPDHKMTVSYGEIQGDGTLILKLYYDRLSYDYTFKNWNDEVLAAGSIPYGDVVPVPEDPIKEGYAFTGWSGVVPEFMPAESISVKAEYAINSYTLSFNSNGGSPIASITKEYGDEVGTVVDPVREGYLFRGWSPAIPKTVPAKDSSYVAEWVINQYVVYFEENGGSTVVNLRQDYNTLITYPIKSIRAGYTFEGWFTDGGLTNEWNFEEDRFPARDFTLYAKWSANTDTKYVVNHYKEKLDGTFELADEEQLAGITDTAVSATAKSYTGFTVDRTHEDEVATGIIDGSKTLVLSLYYQRDSFNVVFRDWDGTLLKEVTLKYESGAKAPTGMTREGYTFTHWDQDFTKVTENLEVKAIYKINQYDIFFEENGGSEVGDLRQDFDTYIENAPVTVKAGYIFEGWFVDENFVALWNFEGDKVPANHVTLYAKWTVRTDTLYTVKHYKEALDGSYVEFETDYLTGTTDGTAEAVPKTYDGFTYSDAHKDEHKSGNIAGDGSLELVLYYDRNIYTAAFNTNNGSAVSSADVLFEDLVIEPSAPTKAGYDFLGWYVEENLETAWNFAEDKMPSEDIILYAKWSVRTDTPYAVKHYKEALDGSYVVFETENLTGTTDTEATAVSKIYEGFTYTEGHEDALKSGNVAGDGSLALSLYYARNEYGVSFVSNGGSDRPSLVVSYEDLIEEPMAPTKAGYDFGGWHVEETLETLWGFEKDTMPSEDVTLYAKWTARTDTVYKVKHYKEALDDTYVEFEEDSLTGTTDTEATAAPKFYEGFTYSEAYKDELKSGNIAGDGSLELALYYDRNIYTAVFNTNNGSAVSSANVLFEDLVIEPSAPTRAGYDFLGWYVEENLETAWNFAEDKMPSEDIILYAKWSVRTDTPYAVKHYKEALDGSYVVFETENLTGTTDTEATAAPKIYEGFTYHKDHEDEVKLGNILGEGTLVLALYYSRNEYTAVFDSNNGSAVSSANVLFEDFVEEPATPVRSGYDFGGWFLDETLETEWDFEENRMPSEDVTLYAKWTARTDTVYKVKHYKEALDGTYVEFEEDSLTGTTDTEATAAPKIYEGFTYHKDYEDEVKLGNILGEGTLVLALYYSRNEYYVRFKGFNGITIDEKLMMYGEEMRLPENPVKAGYIFTGWSQRVPETVPAKDLTVDSLWEITPAEEVRQKIEALPALSEVGKGEGEELIEIRKLLDQLTEEELKYLTPEIIEKYQKSSTVYAELSLTDEKTKVYVRAGEDTYFDPNLKLVVEEVKLGALKDTADKNLLTIRKNKEILQVFDISLLLNNVEVQPDGIIRIYLPLSKELKNSYKDLEVIYVAEDGKITVMPSKVEGDYLVFETDHLSYYSIIGTKINALPSLGEETSSAALGFLLLAVGLCLYVPWRKRKTA